MNAPASRRAFLGAAALLPALVVPVAAAAAPEADAHIHAAWAEWIRLSSLNYATPGDAWTNEQEAAFYRLLDAAEVSIERAMPTTPRGAAIQLWVSLAHSEDGDRALHEAIVHGEKAAVFARYDDLNWTSKLIVKAIRALETMEG